MKQVADILNTASAGQSPAAQAILRQLQGSFGTDKNTLLNVDDISSSDSDVESNSSLGSQSPIMRQCTGGIQNRGPEQAISDMTCVILISKKHRH